MPTSGFLILNGLDIKTKVAIYTQYLLTSDVVRHANNALSATSRAIVSDALQMLGSLLFHDRRKIECAVKS